MPVHAGHLAKMSWNPSQDGPHKCHMRRYILWQFYKDVDMESLSYTLDYNSVSLLCIIF